MSLTAKERRHALIARAVPFNASAQNAYRQTINAGGKRGEAAEAAVRAHYELPKFKKAKGQLNEYDLDRSIVNGDHKGETKLLAQSMYQEAGATGDEFKQELTAAVAYALGATGRSRSEWRSYVKKYMRIEDFEQLERELNVDWRAREVQLLSNRYVLPRASLYLVVQPFDRPSYCGGVIVIPSYDVLNATETVRVDSRNWTRRLSDAWLG